MKADLWCALPLVHVLWWCTVKTASILPLPGPICLRCVVVYRLLAHICMFVWYWRPICGVPCLLCIYSQDSINTTSTRPYLPALYCGVQFSSIYLYVCVILKANLWWALSLLWLCGCLALFSWALPAELQCQYYDHSHSDNTFIIRLFSSVSVHLKAGNWC